MPETTDMTDTLELPHRPRFWKYVLLSLSLLFVGWAFLRLLAPELLRRRPWLLVLPVLATAIPLGVQLQASNNAQAAKASQEKEQARLAAEAEKQAKAIQDHEVFTLEVLGVGTSLEMFRNVKLWEATKANPGSYLLPTDPKAYPWSSSEKSDNSVKRAGDCFEQGGSYFVEKWDIPAFLVGPENFDPKIETQITSPLHHQQIREEDAGEKNCLIQGLWGTSGDAGMHYHQFVVIETRYDDQPERIWENVFAFFDAHPEAPAALLYAGDGLGQRTGLDNSKFGLTGTGYRKPGEMSESMTTFVVARRDRVEALRPYARKESADPQPFWETQRLKGFKPSAFLPEPWTETQLAAFDKLPVLGRIHRPRWASFVDGHGKRLGPKGRSASLAKALKSTLAGLPPGQAPQRLIEDHGSAAQSARLAELGHAFYLAGHGDFSVVTHGVNLTQCFGELGADSFFVGTAIGLYASHRDGGASAIVGLRREDGALVMVVTPPTDEERKKPHPAHGGHDDPLNFRLAP